MSPYQLQSPCRVEDGDYIAESKISAFYEEAWWRLSWGPRSRESMIKSIQDRSPKNLLTDREVRRHQKVVDLDSGEIVGYARWILPESHKDSWLTAQTPDVSDEDKEIFAKRHAETEWHPRDDTDVLDEHIAGWREKHKHDGRIELHYIGVNPGHQRKGVGSLLVSSGLDEAKKLGLDVYLVAMGRRALGLYLKHGFEILEEKIQGMNDFGVDELYETFFMIWRAPN